MRKRIRLKNRSSSNTTEKHKPVSVSNRPIKVFDRGGDKQPISESPLAYLGRVSGHTVSELEDLADDMINFGFSIGDREKFIYVDVDRILMDGWSQDLRKMMLQLNRLPRLYSRLSNLRADIVNYRSKLQRELNQLRASYLEQIDTPLADFENWPKWRIDPAIDAEQPVVTLSEDLAEVDTILDKLKGVIRAVEMQNQLLYAAVRHYANNGAIMGNSAIGSYGVGDSAVTSTEDIEACVTRIQQEK